MKHDWIIDVLSDIAKFAEKNALPKTFESLLDTMIAASAELADQNITANLSATPENNEFAITSLRSS